MKLKYYIFNKPYNVLSQFTREAGNQSIADYFILDSKDIYPIGRLDKDSEGMLILTNDKSLNALVLSPKQAKSKTYLVQVEGQINKAAISKLCSGVTITVDQKPYQTLPAFAKIIDPPKYLWERSPAVRYRKDIPTSWVEVRIQEGKNRQVRKMLAEVGFPVLRLIRVAIQDLFMEMISPGDIQEIERAEIMRKLKIK